MFITLEMAKISTPFGDFKRTYDKNFPDDDTDIEFHPRSSEWGLVLRRISIGDRWWVQKFLAENQILDCVSAIAQLQLAWENYVQQLKDDKGQEKQYVTTKSK